MTSPRRALRWRKLALIAIGVFVGWCLIAFAGAKFLIVKADLAAADAIFVFSGPGTYVERADWAAKLYREKRAPLVVVSNEGLLSGWSATDERNLYFYELSARRLEQQGVARKDIRVMSGYDAGTYRESVKLCGYVSDQGFKRVLVVTSAYHSRRAFWSVQRACGDQAIQIGIDSPPPGWQTPRPEIWWAHRIGWRFVAAEYVKMVYYRLSY